MCLAEEPNTVMPVRLEPATPQSSVKLFENSVDPNQLASKKPADLDLHCFQNMVYLCLGQIKQ